MSNAYTTRGGLIQPEVGQNLNTWGDLLNNNNFPLVDKALFGFEVITVTGDFSLTRVNGQESNTQINKAIYLTGTPTADFAVTFLSYEQSILFVNDTGRNATVKVSAGTGVTLADGDIAILGYNATLGDVTNVSPNRVAGAMTVGGGLTVGGKVSNVTAGTAGTDAVNLTQLSNAIAAILTSGDGSILVQATDSTRKFLASALLAAATSGIAFTVAGGSGANQTLNAALAIDAMNALTSPADADRLPLYDASGAAHFYMTLANLLVTGWPAITAPADAGTVLHLDSATGLLKKITLANLLINGWTALTDSDAADKLLVYDTSASLLKSMTKARFQRRPTLTGLHLGVM